MDWTAFATGLATLTLIYGLLAVGLNTQYGFTGVLNFGYVAFFAVGAFTSAIVTLPPPGSTAYIEAGARYTIGLGQPFLLGLVLAGVAGGLLALLIGATSIRLQAHYLAIATFAMAEVVRSVLINETWLTRGEFGITNVPQPGKGTLITEDAYAFAYLALTLIIVAVFVAVTMRVTNKPFGRLLRAIRDDETAARALAKDVTTTKLKALVLGGVLAGVAGSVWTHSLGVVHVGQFVPIITFQIWLAMLLGGVGNHWGVLAGALLLVVIREGTRFIGDVPGLAELAAAYPSALPSLRFVIIGLLLILVIRYFPRGVVPEIRRHAPATAAQIEREQASSAAAVAPAAIASKGNGSPDQLVVEGVVKHFGGIAAVNGASFTIRRGGITGLIGPNGAGQVDHAQPDQRHHQG